MVMGMVTCSDAMHRIQMDIKDRERARKKMGPVTVVRSASWLL